MLENVAIMAAVLALACVACRKPPPDEQQPRKPRVDLMIVLATDDGGTSSVGEPPDVVTVTPASPPASRQMFERSGIHVAVVGVPSRGDPEPLMKTAVVEAEGAGSNATVLVTARCLRDLEPALEKNIAAFWTLALVVGARCDGPVKPNIGAAALIEVGGASKVRVTFDRHTRAFLKVLPLP